MNDNDPTREYAILHWRLSVSDLATDIKDLLRPNECDELAALLGISSLPPKVFGEPAAPQPGTITRRYAVTVLTEPRDADPGIGADAETLHVHAYTAADALVQVDLHNLRATGSGFRAAVTSIEPYQQERHGEWKQGRLRR